MKVDTDTEQEDPDTEHEECELMKKSLTTSYPDTDIHLWKQTCKEHHKKSGRMGTAILLSSCITLQLQGINATNNLKQLQALRI